MKVSQTSAAPKTILCIGGANVDEVLRLSDPLNLQASNRVATTTTAGGIARNVAQNLCALGAEAGLVSAVGEDGPGDWLLAETKAAGVDTSQMLKRDCIATGRYLAALSPGGDLEVGFADMAAVESLCRDEMANLAPEIARADYVFADTNLNRDTLAYLVKIANRVETQVAVDLVSPHKAKRLCDCLAHTKLVVGNRNEALALLARKDDPNVDAGELAKAIVAQGASRAVISDGGGEIGWCETVVAKLDKTATRRFGTAAPLPATIVNVTGAGDALHAEIIISLARGHTLEEATQNGLKIAALMVASSEHALTLDLLN